MGSSCDMSKAQMENIPRIMLYVFPNAFSSVCSSKL